MTMLSPRNALVLFILATLTTLAASCAAKPAPAPVLETKETVLCMLDYAQRTLPHRGEMYVVGGGLRETLAISPDGKRTAYTTSLPDDWFVAVVDDAGGKKYDEIVTFQYPNPLYKNGDRVKRTYFFSPDSTRLAYVARTYRSYFVVADGVESAPYDEIYNLAFSPDSKHMAFAAEKAGQVVVVRDGVEGKMYDAPPRPRRGEFAPTETRQRAALGIPAEGQYIDVNLLFSPDSQHLAYSIVDKDWKHFVVLDGVEMGQCAPGTPFTFSPDSSRLAYFAPGEKGCYVVMKGVDGKDCGVVRHDLPFFIVRQSVIFSPDSKHFAYTAFVDGKYCVVFDNVPGEGYAQIREDSLTFSPDSAHFAYVAAISGHKGKMCLVFDGTVRDEGDNFHYLTFSPDSKRFACVVWKDKRYYVVLDGNKGAEYDGVDSPVFSPDSQHLAYRTTDNRYQFVILDGRKGREHYNTPIWSLTFSPDSKHLAYNMESVLVLDGAESPPHHQSYNNDIVFTAPDKCRIYVWNGSGGISILEATAPAPPAVAP